MSYFLAFISKILLFKGNCCLFNQSLYEIHIYQICLRMPFFILKGQFIAFTDALLSIIHSFFSKKVIISGLRKWNHIFLRSFSLLVAAPQSGTRKIQSMVHLVKGEIEYRLCFLYSYILHQWLVGRSQIGIKKTFYINEGGGSLGMS